MVDWNAARTFLVTHGRILERRALLARYEGGDVEAVRHAVLAHRNPDGGFGHALEADVRSPHSQPLACEAALEHLLAAGIRDPEVGVGICELLTTFMAPGGAVPILLPSIDGYPRASHWETSTYEPAINPTASIAGLLHAHGVRHTWLDDATAWCFETLERDGPPAEAHAARCALLFLEHTPDQERTDALARAVVAALPTTAWYRHDADDPEYGVTPLDLAPRPDSRWAALFDQAELEAHLGRLERDQQPDGGWPITWDAPGDTAVLEWRGVVTLRALDSLASYGRVTPGG